MTVGTGIGVGHVIDGHSVPATRHGEAGHMRIPRAADDTFAGTCPFHGDCAEGLACGPAMAERWGAAPETLDDAHPAWTLQAWYVAMICSTLVYTLRPDRIVIGGGVFGRASLYPRVRTALRSVLSGYALSEAERDLERFISPPGLVDPSPGLVGAFELARGRAAERVDA